MWNEPSTWISLAAAIFAAAAALFAWRSSVAQDRSVQEQKRANDMLVEQQEQAREANRFRWKVERVAGYSLALRNHGTDSAYDVRVTSSAVLFSGGPILNDTENVLGAHEVEPGAAIRFTIVPPAPYVGSGRGLRVTWRGKDEPEAVPLPSLGGVTGSESRHRESIWRSGGGVPF